jgi:phospholipid/cholesterol/gamma-HCH transport system substrate-binding protein
MLHRQIKIQLAIFAVVALVGGAVMVFGYMKAPANYFGIGRYTVILELPAAAGLYKTGNVSYRGTNVGRVKEVRLTDSGVEAVLSLNRGIDIPSDVNAEVHSVSAIGEQYVALLPRSADSPPLRDGDVIPIDRASIPPDINDLLDATNRGLEAIPRENLQTAVDEAAIAIGGLGPAIRRFVHGATQLAIDSRENLDPLVDLIEQSQPVLDSQVDTADSIRAWAANMATITEDLRLHDASVSGMLQRTPQIEEVRRLFDRLQPTVPIIAANLVSTGDVLLTYQPAVEQLLVLLPPGVAMLQGIMVPTYNVKTPMKAITMDFNLNLNLPPPCTTGFLPASQRRSPAALDFPDRVPGDLYCRVPQDSMFNVRGARNLPCITRPGKRAATVALCESDEEYVPLNEGYNWKGDPNATVTGQDIPQIFPPREESDGEPPVSEQPEPETEPLAVAVAEYDPVTGSYIGPDGRVYTQANLGQAHKEQTWQNMLMPQQN